MCVKPLKLSMIVELITAIKIYEPQASFPHDRAVLKYRF